jgi:anaerobic selenocysteine-containing dehydrogenase
MAREKSRPAHLSRRTLLRGAVATAAAGTAFAGGIQSAHAAKASQKAVQYQDTPKNNQSCSNCRSFVAPSECKTVDGAISPNGWCRIYIKQAS